MEKVSNNAWKDMFGYDPGRALKMQILEDVRNTGCDIREAASRYILPVLERLEENGTFWSSEFNRRMTPAEYYRIHRLGRFARLVLYTRRKKNDRGERRR